MNIDEYNLVIESDIKSLELIYRGNENIIIRCKESLENETEVEVSIVIPRDILTKFLEMIR